MSTEAMKQMVHELEYVFDCINKDKIPFDGDDFHEALRLGRQAIAEAEQEQGEPLEYWNAVEGLVKLDEVREHFDSVSCGTIYKNGGEGRVPLCLAQPKQEQGEPVAYINIEKRKLEWANKYMSWDTPTVVNLPRIPLYTTLQPAPQGEPVAWMFQHEETGRIMFVEAQQLEYGFEEGNPRLKKITPLYTTPQQRTWVGLTDEEIGMAFRVVFPVGGVVFTNGATEFAQTIEQALKERNT